MPFIRHKDHSALAVHTGLRAPEQSYAARAKAKGRFEASSLYTVLHISYTKLGLAMKHVCVVVVS